MRLFTTLAKSILWLVPGFWLLLSAPGGIPEAAGRSGPASFADGALPLSFEANRGQTDPAVKFLARGADQIIFLTSTEAVSVLTRREGARGPGKVDRRPPTRPG